MYGQRTSSCIPRYPCATQDSQQRAGHYSTRRELSAQSSSSILLDKRSPSAPRPLLAPLAGINTDCGQEAQMDHAELGRIMSTLTCDRRRQESAAQIGIDAEFRHIVGTRATCTACCFKRCAMRRIS